MTRTSLKARGFTLIEILVVIGIIAILAAIVIIAINPAKQFAQARNTQRLSDLNTLLNGVGQDLADNKGVFTCSGIGTAIGTPGASTTIGTASGNSNLESCLVPTYIPFMVTDPDGGTHADTKYEISVDTVGRYMLCSLKSDEAPLGLTSKLCVKR